MPFDSGKGKGKIRRGRGFRGGKNSEEIGNRGRSVNCICPNCGMKIPHQPGLPCFQTKCPECNSPMARQFFHEE